MDLEIIKDDGSTYRMSDYGIVYDFVVGSIEVERYHDRMEGRSGTIDYGADYGVRRISVPMKFKAFDLHDYAHLRDELYGIVSELEPYYIREKRRLNRLQYDFVDFGSPEKWREGTDNQYVNGKQYRVMLTNEITPEQIMNGGEITLEFVTVGLPFAETIYTTKELNDTGYDATVEKYGLVDGIHADYTQYRFTENTFEVYNAGNVTIRPENMFLEITIGLLTTDGSFELRNLTTRETFEWQKAVTDRNIYIRGMGVMEGTAFNGLRNTNRKFIKLKPGVNKFEVVGGTFSQITVDFRYLYK